MSERRKTGERISCFLCGRRKGAENLPHQVGCEDISPGGMRIWSIKRLEPGSEVSIDIITNNLSLLPFSGVVRWCRQGYHGWRAGIALEKNVKYNLKELV